jgi:hypothetical protein
MSCRRRVERVAEMVSSDCLQFGSQPRSWFVEGVVFLLAGTLFCSFGVYLLLIICEEERLSTGGNIMLCLVFMSLGLLALLVGVMEVVKRNKLRIVMTGQAIRVGTITGSIVIPYKDIRRVTDGIDDVLLEIADKLCLVAIEHGRFTSMRERGAFMEVLSKIIGGPSSAT